VAQYPGVARVFRTRGSGRQPEKAFPIGKGCPLVGYAKAKAPPPKRRATAWWIGRRKMNLCPTIRRTHWVGAHACCAPCLLGRNFIRLRVQCSKRWTRAQQAAPLRSLAGEKGPAA